MTNPYHNRPTNYTPAEKATKRRIGLGIIDIIGYVVVGIMAIYMAWAAVHSYAYARGVAEGEEYYVIHLDGRTGASVEDGDALDKACYEIGDYFYTREANEAWAKWRKLDIAYRRASWAEWDRIGKKPSVEGVRYCMTYGPFGSGYAYKSDHSFAGSVYFPLPREAAEITRRVLGDDAEFYFTYDHSRG